MAWFGTGDQLAYNNSMRVIEAKILLAILAGGGGGGGGGLHGNGPPAPGLGTDGQTYVDDLTGQFYWKSSGGWNP